MIIALEGLETTGKTSVARVLETGLNGAKRYRALRRDNEKWAEGELDRWRKIGVPANTFVEDVYAVDTIDKIKPERPVILDRCLISGIVYDVHERFWHVTPSNVKLNRAGVEIMAWFTDLMKSNEGSLTVLEDDLESIQDEIVNLGRGDMPTLKALELRRDRMNACFEICEAQGLDVARYEVWKMTYDSIADDIARRHGTLLQLQLPFGNGGI